MPDNEEIYLEISVPNYHGDLNEIRKAVLTLDRPQSREFFNHLLRLILDCEPAEGEANRSNGFRLLTATAQQWAEAFLCTIGKWKGGEE